jgi:hypothetical protein
MRLLKEKIAMSVSASGFKLVLKSSVGVATAIVFSTAFAQTALAEFYKSGSMTISADAETELTYDDNIFSSSSDEEEDFITQLIGKLTARSLRESDDVILRLNAEANRYADHSEQNNEQFRVIGSWKHDFSDQFNMKFSGDVRRAVTARGNTYEDPEATPVSDTESYIGSFGLDANYQINRYVLDGGVGYRFRDYKDTYRRNGSLISNSDRNYGETYIYVQPGYLVAPNTTAYVKAEVSDREFHDSEISNVRDNDGYLVAAGVRYNVPSRLTADFWAGYQNYDYASEDFNNTSAFAYNADVRWMVSDAWEARFRVWRDFNPTTSGTTSVIVSDSASASISYEIVRNLSISGELSVKDRTYRRSSSAASGGVRKDDYYVGALGAEYSLTENWLVGAQYEHRMRDSNAQNVNISRNLSSVFVKVTF